MAGVYDLMLLIDPNAPEERRTSAVSEAESLLSSGGEIVAQQDWGQRRMAYEIDHRPEAEYRLYQFNGDKDLLERLNQRLRINDAVLRFRIIKSKPGAPLPPGAGAAVGPPPRGARAPGHPRGGPRRSGRPRSLGRARSGGRSSGGRPRGSRARRPADAPPTRSRSRRSPGRRPRRAGRAASIRRPAATLPRRPRTPPSPRDTPAEADVPAAE